MQIHYYQIDAFASEVFSGNPAGVCPLDEWLDDPLLQSIAAENNLSETAFFVRETDGLRIRWFTPAAEVDLCGHATLAAAYVIFNHIQPELSAIEFLSRSGILKVRRDGEFLVLDFPSQPPKECEVPQEILDAIPIAPIEVLASEDYFVVLPNESDLAELEPDLDLLKKLGLRGVIFTAPGNEVDFVSRFFAPNYGITEDPVTGSAHCALTPYWSERLGRTALTARQLSKRGGELRCRHLGNRTEISGRAVGFMRGTIEV